VIKFDPTNHCVMRVNNKAEIKLSASLEAKQHSDAGAEKKATRTTATKNSTNAKRQHR
jgi:hypothetical protein